MLTGSSFHSFLQELWVLENTLYVVIHAFPHKHVGL